LAVKHPTLLETKMRELELLVDAHGAPFFEMSMSSAVDRLPEPQVPLENRTIVVERELRHVEPRPHEELALVDAVLLRDLRTPRTGCRRPRSRMRGFEPRTLHYEN
jgi:hypothetical protein